MISVIVPTLGNINEINFRYQLYNKTETVPFEIIFSIPKKISQSYLNLENSKI